jgi:TatD DNase family protein
MIFESHAHYDDEAFDGDREALFNELTQKGIGFVINVTAEYSHIDRSLALAKSHPFIYSSIGVHPSEIQELNEETFAIMRSKLKAEKVVAVGEIGLDYYWEKDPAKQEAQRFWFRRQLALAKEAELPVIIHSREAAEDTLEIMKEAAAQGIPGVIHCYSYSKEMAAEYLKMGYYLGIGGVVTYKNGRRLKETVEEAPLDRLLLETDCPYLAPEPHRGTRNSSLHLPLVIQEIARLKGLSETEVEEATAQNAKELFHV